MAKKYLMLVLYCLSVRSISEEELSKIRKSVSKSETDFHSWEKKAAELDRRTAEHFQDPSLIFDTDACYQDALAKLSKEELTPPGCQTPFSDLALLYGIGVFVSIEYIYLRYTIYKAKKYLSQPNLLSSFRNDLSIEELFSIPKNLITEWILEEIEERYPDPNPIKAFYKEVQKEEQQLKAHLITYLNLKGLSWFFDVSAIADIPARLRVLEHLKNLVLIWEIESHLPISQAETQPTES